MMTENPRGTRHYPIVEGAVVLIVFAVLLLIVVPVSFTHAHDKAFQSKCMNNQRQINLAVQIWVQDHKEVLPKAAEVWQGILLSRDTLVCPMRRDLVNGYCYSNAIAGKPMGVLAKGDPTTILVTCDGFNSDRSKLPNICYGVQDVAFRHEQRAIGSFLDGHCELTGAHNPQWFSVPRVKPVHGK